MHINDSLPPTGGPVLSTALGFQSSLTWVISTADRKEAPTFDETSSSFSFAFATDATKGCCAELDTAAGARIRDLDGSGLAIVTAISARLFWLATNQ